MQVEARCNLQPHRMRIKLGVRLVELLTSSVFLLAASAVSWAADLTLSPALERLSCAESAAFEAPSCIPAQIGRQLTQISTLQHDMRQTLELARVMHAPEKGM